jgi:hypothetical protein
MTLFFQILFSNAVLLCVLITVHELGHWFFGRLVGIPPDQMKIRLLTFPQQVQIRDSAGWVSVSTFDRYFNRLREIVPSSRGQFAYVVGGFVFETLFLILLTVFLGGTGYWLYAIVAPGVSLVMYLVYVFAMDIPQSKHLKRPWGDTTILFSLSPRGGVVVAASMVLVRAALIACSAFQCFW